MSGRRSLEEALLLFGGDAERRLLPAFAAAAVSYPPAAISLLAFKCERLLELWAGETGRERLIRCYPILGASGGPGPKLREGDGQVPEGIYRVEYLNPNSRYHLSFKLDYPNAFDREQALSDGRTDPGSDIFIHGGERSVGCLAMGDDAIEELFVLVARAGREAVTVVIAPHDLHRGDQALLPPAPPWCARLYAALERALAPFRS